MYGRLKLFAFAAAFATISVLSCLSAAAQPYLGLFSSPKGYGMSAVFTGREEGAVNVITLYADTYGMASNRTREAGVVASYTRNYIFKTIDAEYAIFDFYAGAGAASGYVHDFERGFFNKTNIELTRERSVMAALSGNIGAHAEFGRRLSLELSFRADVGIAMRRNRSNGAMLLSFYKNGIFHTLYPQLTLLFRL